MLRKRYKPAAPFVTAMKLLTPTYAKKKGVPVKEWPEDADAPTFFGTFRTFGGTEMTETDLYTVVNTGTIDTWYRPDIRSNCGIRICETGELYEVVGDPEDIEMRHQFLRIRVQKVGGGA